MKFKNSLIYAAVLVMVLGLSAVAAAAEFTDSYGDFDDNQASFRGMIFVPAKAAIAPPETVVPQTVYLKKWTFAESSTGYSTAGQRYLAVAAYSSTTGYGTILGVSSNSYDFTTTPDLSLLTWEFDYIAMDKDTTYAMLFVNDQFVVSTGAVELTVSATEYPQGGVIQDGNTTVNQPTWKPHFAAIYSTTASPYPSTPSPADGGENVAANVTLSWSAPTPYTPLGYNVYLDKGEPNLTAALAAYYSPNQPGLTYAPGTLGRGVTYYWRVEAMEPNAVAPYTPIANSSPVWAFTTLPEGVVITKQPVDQTVTAGTTVFLTVEALNGQTYQWYRNGVKLTGQTAATLTLANVQLADEGNYHCVVSNSLPSSATSNAAHLMIRRLVAQWPLDGTLAAVESNPAENWDGVYMDTGPTPTPSTKAVNYVTGVNGVAGGAVMFDGLSIIVVSDANDFFNFHPYGLTLTAWVKGPSGGDFRRFVNKNGSYAAAQHITGTVQMLIDGGPGWTTAVPAAEASENSYGKWRFVAITYDPATAQRVVYGVYDDDNAMDVLHTTTVAQTATALGTGPLLIGGTSATAVGGNFLGSVDDVRIYNYPLTPSQIADVYKEMKGGWLCMGVPAMDTTGPEGVRDCRVDLYDIVAYAEAWLECGRTPVDYCF